MKFTNVRTDGVVGIYENNDSSHPLNLHFSEWWSGGGADFNFNNGDKNISLSMEELMAISIAGGLMNMLDFDEINEEITKIWAEAQNHKVQG